jgi:hypothetical protein
MTRCLPAPQPLAPWCPAGPESPTLPACRGRAG